MNRYLFVIDYQNDFVDGALGFPGAEKLDAKIAAKIHAYGKSVRPGRKIGHVNVLATDGNLEAALNAAIETADIIRHGRTESE